jgi:hypothetical protein
VVGDESVEQFADRLADHPEEEAVPPTSCDQHMPVGVVTFQLLVAEDRTSVAHTESAKMQRSDRTPLPLHACEFGRRLPTGHNQAASMRRFSQLPKQRPVAIESGLIPRYLAPRLENRLEVIQNQQAAHFTQQLYETPGLLSLASRCDCITRREKPDRLCQPVGRCWSISQAAPADPVKHRREILGDT